MFGCAAVAVLTVQSTDGLVACVPVSPRVVLRQAGEVVGVQNVRAIKVGALGSVANVRAVGRWLEGVRVPVVVDPVMLPTRGRARLLASNGASAIKRSLLARATVVTANADEAVALTGQRVTSLREAREAAVTLTEMGAQAGMVKGGHWKKRGEVVDVIAFASGRIVELAGPRLPLAPTHGGGCVLASLVAGYLARRADEPTEATILAAIRRARTVHQRALAGSRDVGGAMRVLLASQ